MTSALRGQSKSDAKEAFEGRVINWRLSNTAALDYRFQAKCLVGAETPCQGYADGDAGTDKTKLL